ncbi:MAG: hypothetical protein JXA82_12935 [Sedimentisphaerales bacterium]|nr:hypothetical protein [Sedimentisphaerales bacterium]
MIYSDLKGKCVPMAGCICGLERLTNDLRIRTMTWKDFNGFVIHGRFDRQWLVV